MQVRTAKATDAATISALMAQLGYSASFDVIQEKLATLACSPDEAVFVAIQGDEVIGCISAHAHELFHVPGRLGRITSLVIDVEARGSGIGRALINRVTSFFRERGCVRIEVTSGNHRSEAHAFYRAVGFVEDERRFILKL